MERFLERFATLATGIWVAFWCGCAAPPATVFKTVTPPTSAVPAPAKIQRAPGVVLVFVPQTDDGAAAWLRWFDRYPRLRLVIALSPRFTHLAKDPVLKEKRVALERAGRLELALQLPNAPFLPLLIDTSSAKDAVPAGSLLPEPPYSYPDDVVQIVARAKADFFRQWNQLPRCLVLPHGAASSRLLMLFDRLGFTWLVAALGAPPADGPYQNGSVLVWDGVGKMMRVWDERAMKESGKTVSDAIKSWVQEMEKDRVESVLPSTPGFSSQPLPPDPQWSRRTWITSDWTPWIGSPAKNAAWGWLRRTREALEAYKNSGQASVHRLDMAFEGFYTAENANFFAAIGNSALAPNVSEEREREFKATLAASFRLIGQAPPDDLFSAPAAGELAGVQNSSTTFLAESLPDGREHIAIQEAAGDGHGNGAMDQRSLEVWASSQSVDWTIAFSSPSEALIDIYIDLNGQPNVGTSDLLPGRKAMTAAVDAWEYAICLAGSQAALYRTQGAGGYELSATLPATRSGEQVSVKVPRSFMRGNPKRWGYQVLVMAPGLQSPSDSVPLPLDPAPGGSRLPPIYDLLDPLELQQTELLNELESGKRSDIPFVRLRANR